MKPTFGACRSAAVLSFYVSLVLGWATVTNAGAQGAAGAIVGTITDSSAGRLPGVTVTVRHLETGDQRTTVTTQRGQYELSYLTIGRYELKAELEGFSNVHVPEVLLTIGQQARVDLSMDIGELRETVLVEAATPLVRTEQSTLSHVITNAQIMALPLNSRDPLSFLTQLPGLQEAAGSYLVSGARAFTTNFQLDGMNITDERSKEPISVPPLDAIGEFELKANLMTAETGSASSQVSIAMKSGTNRFRGSIYEYFRSNLWEATNFFNRTGEVPQRIRHQYGGTLGGPVVKERVFFFASYSGTSNDAALTRTGFVPTAAMRDGDFSALNVQIINPFTRQPFPGNQIPASLIHPVSQKLLDIYPLPNVDHPSRNYAANLPTKSNSQQYIGRLDYVKSSSNRFYGTVNMRDSNATNPGDAAAYGGTTNRSQQRTAIVRHLGILSPRLTNEFSVGAVRSVTQALPQNHGTNWLDELGIVGVPVANEYEAGGMIDTSLAPYLRIGEPATLPRQYVSNNFSLVNNMTWALGSHSIKAGFDIRRNHLNERTRPFTRGLFTFAATLTGDPFAAFLLGVPSTTSGQTARDMVYLRKWDTGYYVQDTWNVSSNLTMNLGLRYELFTNPVEKYDRMSTFDTRFGAIVVSSPNGRFPDRGIVDAYLTTLNFPLMTSTEAGRPRSLARTDRNNLAPRIGFAYRPFGGSRTVLRGGFGVYYYPMRQFLMLTGASNPPFQVTSRASSSLASPLDFAAPFAKNVTLGPANSMYALSPDSKDGRFHNWNLTAERDVGFGTALRVSYVGNRGFNLNQSVDVNKAVPIIAPNGNNTTTREWSRFGAIRLTAPIGTTSYHGVEVEAIKRHSAGISFQANYTWAKEIVSADLDNWEAQDVDQQKETARSNFVPAHTLNANVTYQLPVGKGRRFLNDSNLLNHIAGGWRIAAISKFRSGLWYTPAFSHTSVPGGGNRLFGRPDLVGDPNSGPRTADQWFNPHAFQGVPAGEARFGNSPRAVIEGPGLKVMDMAADKSFRVFRTHRVTIRTEVFNVFNWVNFSLGSFQRDVTFPALAAIINQTATDARQFQFSLRYDF